MLTFGLFLVLATNGLWNLNHSGFFVPVVFRSHTAATTSAEQWEGRLSASGGGNGSASAWDVVEQARARLEGDAIETPSIDVRALLAHAPGKLLGLCRDLESSFQYGYYGERAEIGVLRATPLSFGGLLLLFLFAGFLLCRQGQWRTLVPFLPFLFGVAATAILFHPSTRYRIAAVPVLMVIGAAGISQALQLSRKGRFLYLLPVSALVLFLSFRTVSYQLRIPGMWELRVAEAEAVRGNRAEAVTRIERALAMDPESEDVRNRAKMLHKHFFPTP